MACADEHVVEHRNRTTRQTHRSVHYYDRRGSSDRDAKNRREAQDNYGNP